MLKNSDKINELIVKRVNILAPISIYCKKYLTLAREILSGLDPDFYKFHVNLADEIEKICAKIKSVVGHFTDLTSWAELYNSFSTLVNAAKLTPVLFDNVYTKMTIIGMGSNDAYEFYNHKREIADKIDKFMMNDGADDEIIEFALGLFDNEIMFQFIIATPYTNKFTIKLLGKLLQSDITGGKRNRLELMVEEQKNKLLGSERLSLAGGYLGSLYRYGLQPVSNVVNLADIFRILDVSANDLHDYSTKYSICVVILPRKVSNHIAYNHMGLIDVDYIAENDLVVNKSAGLNKKMIKKYATIYKFPDTFDDVVKNDQIIINDMFDPVLILETFGESTYRILGNSAAKLTPKSDVMGLIVGPTTRPHYYNNIHANIISAKCFNKHAYNLTEPSRQQIGDTVINEIVDKFANYAKNHVKNLQDLQLLVNNKGKIYEIISPILAKTAVIDDVELKLTYLVRADAAVNKISNLLVRQLSSLIILSNAFNNVDNIVAVCKQICKGAMVEFDKNNSWGGKNGSFKETFIAEKLLK